MQAALAVPFALGLLAVLQAALNRRIAEQIGLIPAVILNTAVLLVVASSLLFYLRTLRGSWAHWVNGDGGAAAFGWWWLIPGLCGLSLLAGLPWAIERVGALRTFVWLVSAQMLFSLGWDHFVEHLPVSPQRLTGALLALLGALVTGWRQA